MKCVMALVPAAIVAGALMNVPAQAKCGDSAGCTTAHVETRHKTAKAKTARQKSIHKRVAVRHKKHHSRTRIAAHRHKTSNTRTSTQVAARPASRGARAFAFDAPSSGTGNQVVSMIKSMAPQYGVPTWFALRIAKVESNYNPRVRGRAGEYGIYQIKCGTARGLGFSGGCSQLADARTNIRWGLTHLQAALKSSSGNLKLAASKHNGGLGRRTIVPRYVSMVF